MSKLWLMCSAVLGAKMAQAETSVASSSSSSFVGSVGLTTHRASSSSQASSARQVAEFTAPDTWFVVGVWVLVVGMLAMVFFQMMKVKPERDTFQDAFSKHRDPSVTCREEEEEQVEYADLNTSLSSEGNRTNIITGIIVQKPDQLDLVLDGTCKSTSLVSDLRRSAGMESEVTSLDSTSSSQCDPSEWEDLMAMVPIDDTDTSHHVIDVNVEEFAQNSSSLNDRGDDDSVLKVAIESAEGAWMQQSKAIWRRT